VNNPDTDGDGENDSLEIGPNILTPLDTDGDGIIDALESSIVDTDGDGVFDEADPANTDPCIPNINAGPCDQDNDGLTNAQEGTLGTDPTNPDTNNGRDGGHQWLKSIESVRPEQHIPRLSGGYRCRWSD
jgi:hypothetical protein